MSTNPRREELKALSKGLSVLKKEGAIETINEALVQMYADKGFKELKSLRAWNEAGRVIIKGQKALLLWGRPRQRKQEAQTVPPNSEQEQETDLDFFPLAYVFDVTQTQPRQ